MATLTPQQRQIVKSKKINANRTADETLALLGALAAADKVAEKAASRWGCTGAVVGVVGFIASFIWMSEKKQHLERGGTLLVVTCALVIFFIVMYLRAKVGDLPDNFRITAIPFLTVLREDMSATEPVHVNIDLREAKIKEKMRSQSDPYQSGAYQRVVDSVYVDPWFSGSTTLVDGTTVAWQLADIIRERQRTKRNLSGKTKTKSKSKRKTTATVTMTFASKDFAIDAAGEGVKGKKRTLRLRKAVKSEGKKAPGFQMLVDLIADGYRRVSIARSA